MKIIPVITRFCAICCLLVLSCPIIYAQEDAPEVHIELIIFKHLEIKQDTLDNLLEISQISNTGIQPGYTLTSDSTQTESLHPITLHKDYSLQEEYDKLMLSDEFEVLHQVAWVQPQYDINQAFFISIIPENYGGLLKGNARLTYDRLYQLKLDFLYDLDASFQILEEAQPTEQTTSESKTLLINMSKVMTDTKIYYLDHALIGVLAVIHEKEKEEEAAEPPAAEQ